MGLEVHRSVLEASGFRRKRAQGGYGVWGSGVTCLCGVVGSGGFCRCSVVLGGISASHCVPGLSGFFLKVSLTSHSHLVMTLLVLPLPGLSCNQFLVSTKLS